MKRTLYLLLAVVSASFSCGPKGAPAPEKHGQLLERFEFPYYGPGQVAVVMSSARPNRFDIPRSIAVTSRGVTQFVHFDGVIDARWINQSLLVTIREMEKPDGRNKRLLVFDPVTSQGKDLEGSDAGLWSTMGLVAVPSPDGTKLAVERSPDGNPNHQRLEVWEIARRAKLLGQFEKPEGSALASFRAWARDGQSLCIDRFSRRTVQSRKGMWLQIVVVDSAATKVGEISERGGAIKYIEHDPGVRCLFWGSSGMYAAATRKLLRCDVHQDRCDEVYDLGRHKHIVSGVTIESGRALLLVHDLRNGWDETRATELHEVDLVSGSGRLVQRFPSGVFAESIDWRPAQGEVANK